MRKIGFALFLMSVFGVGCIGLTDADFGNEHISVSLNSTELYEYRTGIGGDEEGASILRQANHYEVSEIVRNEETMWEAVYIYKPKTGFSGKDYVELKLSTGSDGASPNTNIIIIKIEFIIN